MNPISGLNAWNDSRWDYLDTIGEDNFYVVPIKTVGFRPCQRHVPFIRSGKIIIKMDDEEKDYEMGYWWDKVKYQKLSFNNENSLRSSIWGLKVDFSKSGISGAPLLSGTHL